MDLLISEEVVLLGLEEDKGSTTWLESWTTLNAALIVDAILHRAVTVTDDELFPAAAPEHPLLRAVHDAVAAEEKPRTVTDWVTRIAYAFKPLHAVAEHLVERGVLAQEKGKVLGLFSTVRYPEADPEPELSLRVRMRAVLVDGEAPSAHDALLIALLHSEYGRIDAIYDGEERAVRKAAKARAKDIAEHAEDQPGIRGVNEAVEAALIVAVVAPSIVATTAATT